MVSVGKVGFLLLLVAVCVQAQQSYPNGTVMSEPNFGGNTTNPVTCPDGSTSGCVNVWNVLQSGSDVTIVSSPCTGGTGKAVELAAAATVPEIETYSFPVIPKSSSWVLTMKVCIAASVSGFQNLLVLKNASGGSSDVGINANGTSFEWFPGSNTCAGAGTSTINTLTLTATSGSVQFAVNGTNCGSASADSGHVIVDVFLAGMTTSGANVYVQSVSLTGAGTLNGSFPPSFYLDFHGQSGNTVNTTNMQAGVECNSNATTGDALGNWTLGSLVGISYTFGTSPTQSFASNLSACGGSYAGSSGVNLAMAVPTTSGASGSLTNVFSTTSSTVSTGFYIQIVGTGTLSLGLDFIALSSAHGYNLQFQDGSSGGTYKICFENDSGGGSAPCTANLSNSTWYWVTFDLTGTGGTNNAWVYNVNANGSVGSLVNELTEAGTHEPTTPGSITINLSKTGNETMAHSSTLYYSNVIVDLAAAAAPLLPPSASSTGNAFPLLGVGD
jgi:hypothetical protein